MARQYRLGKPSRGARLFRTLFLTVAAVTGLAVLAAGYFLFEFEKPSLVLGREVRALGGKVDLPLEAGDRRSGIRSLTISLSQNTSTTILFERSFARQAWFKAAGPATIKESVAIDAKKAGAKEGKAELLLSVRDFSLNGLFKGNETRIVLPVTIDTRPPRVTINQAQRSIRPGSSGLVVYTASEPLSRHGVTMGNHRFPGFPAARENTYLAYFALPWDSQAPEITEVFAADAAGNETTAALACTFKKEPEKRDSINLSENFLQEKMPEFEHHYPQMQGTPLEKFLFVNNEVRISNAKIIEKACATTDREQLWADRFTRMPGSSKAGFADQRTYVYGGSPVDTQTHLGVDIASIERAPVRAANRGRVVYADYLGIYGNMIIIDHGQGIFSLYSHLSAIEAAVGTMVDKEQQIGRSGTSGMAGGDHLHFSMLVHGIFVTPVEWWDQHWINVNIKSALSAR